MLRTTLQSSWERICLRFLPLVFLIFVQGGAFSPVPGTTKVQSALKMTSSMEQSSKPATKNWRVISATSESHVDDLFDRPLWSESQYQESLDLYHQLMGCTDSYVHPGIKMALNTLDHAYRLYGPASVICSFNGGKDAVVILHLVRAAHAKHYSDLKGTDDEESIAIIRPRVVYFNHPDEFPEVTDFLRQSVNDYDLDMVAFEEGVKFADGLKILVQNNHVQGSTTAFPMAFVLGTRSSDPNAVGQDHFAPSSHWMPPFMRVNPVLEWNYGHVWHFLRLFQLPYCSLYDQGYTSLGTTKDTLPCPALAVTRGPVESEGQNALPKFWPAYMLRDWEQERAGRIKKEKKISERNKVTGTDTLQVTSAPSSVGAMSIGAQLEMRTIIVDETTDESASAKVAGEADDSTVSLENCPNQQKSVGLLIIGDEILKGMTLDQNTNAAAKALRKECVKLSKVVVVSDDQDEIVKEIQRLQKEVDVIITSGGVGPTHDDVTIKSVAVSLGRPMLLHDEMAQLLQDKMNSGSGESLTPAQVKMATLPSNAKLRYLSKDDWPVLQCRNIFILPGVPEFFSKKIESVASYLSSQLERGAAYKVVLRVDEAAIVDILNAAVEKHGNVTFGSYPFVNHPEYKTVLTLEGSLVETFAANSSVPTSEKDNDRFVGSPLRARNSNIFGLDDPIIPKDVRDQYVRLALDDLLRKLPKDSILRVENDDLTPFT